MFICPSSYFLLFQITPSITDANEKRRYADFHERGNPV